MPSFHFAMFDCGLVMVHFTSIHMVTSLALWKYYGCTSAMGEDMGSGVQGIFTKKWVGDGVR